MGNMPYSSESVFCMMEFRSRLSARKSMSSTSIVSTVPNLIAHISKRGREYEQSIRIDYLNGLNDRYEEWISGYKGKLLIVDGDRLKFESEPKDLQQITDQIDSLLYGLF